MVVKAALTGALCAASVGAYSVTVVSQPPTPVISYLDGNTAWPQSFNPSAVQPYGHVPAGLLVRSQNCTFTPGQCVGCNVDGDHPLTPYFPGSVITFARARSDGTFDPPFVVFQPEGDDPTNSSYGTEDPRLALDPATGLYHLFYTCYAPGCPRLCHATTRDPTAPVGRGVWTRLGAVFGSASCNSKSGALLVRDAPPHYLIWGAGTIALATSDDLVTFTTVNASFITTRADSFDTLLVEAGPPPLRLKDGNYVFFHNSANHSSPGSSDFGSYNPGWVILSGSDPSVILARSSSPLLSPSFGWERGEVPYECNVHNVTFLEAAAAVQGATEDVFDVWFGGADAVIGTARVEVTGS